jgi:hypothetical protein
MIYLLLYISESTSYFKEENDLTSIIEKSVANNKLKDITGMLMKNGEFFIQLLEGKKENVIFVFNKIQHDRRHNHVKILIKEEINTRLFPNWNMGLINNAKFELELKDLIPLIHSDIRKIKGTKEKIISILKKFNRISSE